MMVEAGAGRKAGRMKLMAQDLGSLSKVYEADPIGLSFHFWFCARRKRIRH